MFTIGEFSRLARVSCRLLRHYDELGLFKPARVEAATGYRYYSAAQLPRLNRILVLRELGLSLEQIAEALREDLPAASLRGMLLLRRGEIARSIESESQRLRQVEGRIAQIEVEGRLNADDVVLRSEPARVFLSTRRTVASFAEGARLLGALAERAPQRLAGRPVGPLAAVAHAAEFELEDIDVEFGLMVESALDGPVRLGEEFVLHTRALPAVERLAACVRVGPPQEAHLTTARIARFIEAGGYRICGATREVFLQRPSAARMHEAVVEMQFPIASI
jgi:DNA-binding transcriptional MerR regulator